MIIVASEPWVETRWAVRRLGNNPFFIHCYDEQDARLRVELCPDEPWQLVRCTVTRRAEPSTLSVSPWLPVNS